MSERVQACFKILFDFLVNLIVLGAGHAQFKMLIILALYSTTLGERIRLYLNLLHLIFEIHRVLEIKK